MTGFPILVKQNASMLYEETGFSATLAPMLFLFPLMIKEEGGEKYTQGMLN